MVYSVQEDALCSPGYEISGTVNAIIFLCMYTRTVRYTDIPKISVLNQYRYIDTGYSTIPIYRNFGYTGIFRYTVLNLPTIWRNHNLYFTTEWQFKELSTAMI